MTKNAMIQELANVGIIICGERRMKAADVRRYYDARFNQPATEKEEITMSTNLNVPDRFALMLPIAEKHTAQSSFTERFGQLARMRAKLGTAKIALTNWKYKAQSTSDIKKNKRVVLDQAGKSFAIVKNTRKGVNVGTTVKMEDAGWEFHAGWAHPYVFVAQTEAEINDALLAVLAKKAR